MFYVLVQGGLPTTGDIYEVALETEKGIVERLQIFDTPGSVSVGSSPAKRSNMSYGCSIYTTVVCSE